MDSHSLQSFYEAAASVAGALIGLLFVAVSVAQARPGEEGLDRHQVPAAGALTYFTNALLVALTGLIENGEVANVAAYAGIAGLTFVIASLISLVRRKIFYSRDLVMLAWMAGTFIFQIIIGFSNSGDPGKLSVQHTIAFLMVFCFLSGISRSWELTGARQFALSREISSLVTGKPVDGPVLTGRPVNVPVTRPATAVTPATAPADPPTTTPPAAEEAPPS